MKKVIIKDSSTNKVWTVSELPEDMRKLPYTFNEGIYTFDLENVYSDEENQLVTVDDLKSYYADYKTEYEEEGISESDYIASCMLQSGGCLTEYRHYLNGLETLYLESLEDEETPVFNFDCIETLLKSYPKHRAPAEGFTATINNTLALYAVNTWIYPDATLSRRYLNKLTDLFILAYDCGVFNDYDALESVCEAFEKSHDRQF